MLSRLICALIAAAALMLAGPEASAERRVALVVGNAQYAHAPTLRNPPNDATDMAEARRKLGFEVVLGLDLDQRDFAQKIDEFARVLDDADVALFYYTGHGLQLNEKNYLVSTDAQLASEFLVSSETIELDAIVRLMEQKAPINLVLLDACRNNPLADGLRRSVSALKRSASLGRGLARVEPHGRDTLIAFAAAPGQEAADGTERNSPFTAALLRHIGRPGEEVSVMLKEVAAEVRRDTGNAQRSQQLSEMTLAFYFVQGTQVAQADRRGRPEAPRDAVRSAPVGSSSDEWALDIVFWNSAQAANECEAVRAYLARFPNGLFVELARITERRLCAAQASATEPAPVVVGTPVPGATPPSDPQPLAAQPALTSLGQTGAPQGAPQVAPPASEPTAPAAPVRRSEPPPVAPAPAAAPAPSAAPGVVAPAVVAAPMPAPAAAPSSPGPTAPMPSPAPPTEPPGQLIRSIQLELVRVGCSAGAIDGNWSPDTQEAVLRFNEHGRWRFDPRAPSANLLAALRRNESRVCPLECGEGYEARGNSCVAISPPPALQGSKKATRSPEKARAAAPHRETPSDRASDRKRRKAERAQERRAKENRQPARRVEGPARPSPQPAQAAPYRCMMDEGQGRMRPCDAGR